ncbi:MAG: hypothetical protein FWC87_02215 [Acidimicrobiaceae bacterium]|nr:hypothetical protein [Acidimicrobiaceae bacterium]
MRRALLKFGRTEDWSLGNWIFYICFLVWLCFALLPLVAGLFGLIFPGGIHVQQTPVSPAR